MKILLTVLTLFIGCNLFASHSAGGYFQYECIGNGTYKVDFYFLRQCGSGNPEAPNFIGYDIFNDCGLACGLNTVNAPLISYTNIDFGCGNNCEGGDVETGPSTQLYYYSAIVNLSSECSAWYISADIYARNTVDYAQSTFADNYYTYCMINTSSGICNSSVQYSGIPFAIGCANGLGKSMYSISNPDGNTLVYSFVDPLVGDCSSNGPVDFVGGATTTMPYPSSGNFNLNNSNGEFTFEPIPIGTSYFAVKVSEYSGATLVGETIIDGLVFSSSSCELGGTVNFGNWQGYNGSNILISEVEQEYCGSFILEANDNGESITNVTVNSLYFVESNIVYNSDGTATVEVCVTVPEEYQCQDLEVLVIAEASTSDGGCISQLTGTGYSGYYTFTKPKGIYCPEYLFFTNRNTTSGLIMPNFARADNTIWVGDNMPSPLYDPAISGVEGDVFLDGDLYLIAGNQIFLPSCDVGTSCVTITGDVTLEISPFGCNSDCAPIPLDVTVHEIFQCGNERLVAETTGNGPFTYKWVINGQTTVSSNNTLIIHDVVSNYNSGQIPYSLQVFDASNNNGTFNGQILGTKVFYEDIMQNVIYFEYDPGDLFESGYYYAGQPGVDFTRPFFIADSVNTNPPWYGATSMELAIWDRWGAGQDLVHYYNRDLENGEDWSFDNGEIYWNGHWWNDVNSPCVEGVDEWNVLPYILTARNCYTAVHQEISALLHLSCFDGTWTPSIAKSMYSQENETQIIFGASRYLDIADESDNDLSQVQIYCVPNPAQNSISLRGDLATYFNVKIFDNKGRIMSEFDSVNANEEINIENFSAGIYIIEIGAKKIKFSKL